jgi:hypothetical protein
MSRPLRKEGYTGPGERGEPWTIFIDGEYFLKTTHPDSVIDLQIEPEFNVVDTHWDSDKNEIHITTGEDIAGEQTEDTEFSTKLFGVIRTLAEVLKTISHPHAARLVRDASELLRRASVMPQTEPETVSVSGEATEADADFSLDDVLAEPQSDEGDIQSQTKKWKILAAKAYLNDLIKGLEVGDEKAKIVARDLGTIVRKIDALIRGG